MMLRKRMFGLLLLAGLAVALMASTASAWPYGGCHTPVYRPGCHTPAYMPGCHVPVYRPVYRPSCYPSYAPSCYPSYGHGCHR